MKPAVPPALSRGITALLLLAGLLWLAPAATAATTTAGETGVRWLQAEFPAQVTLLNADGEQLAAAVGKTTLAHQADAPTILRAALTRGVKKLRRGEERMPCACAKRIFSVSIAAAPSQASALLDLATELYPDCATELAGALRDYDRVAYDYKDRVNDKNVVADPNGPARHDPNFSGSLTAQPASGDPFATSQDPGDLSARDITGLGLGDSYGFGSGFGPGFPGSPGFVGSAPSGGLALPPSPVTAAING